MLTFETIERDYSTAHVRVAGREGLAGVLRVAKRSTTIDLLCSEFFHFSRGENGWFDIEMIGPSGQKILAHNAISTGSGNYFGETSEVTHFASIIPNIMIIGPAADRDGLVKSVHFRMKKFGVFFDYEYTETLQCSKMSEKQRDELLSLRYDPHVSRDFSAPSQIFLVHELGNIIEFYVEGLSYKIWMGGKGRIGGIHSVEFDVYPSASIQFDEPVHIDDALEKVWDWRRFFVQLSMQNLNFDAIGVATDDIASTPVSSVYLPNLDVSEFDQSYNDLHPARIPLNQWSERDALSRAMQDWLLKQNGRQAFRSRLDKVIRNMNHCIDQMDLIELSSGIDSLSELDCKATFPDGLMDAMVQAAQNTATAAEVEIESSRLRGVLSQLQRRSLAEKIKELGRRALPDANPDDISLVVRTARKCRDDAAHRGVVSEQRQARIGPTVEALASMCVAFDLRDAGVPIRASATSECAWKRRFQRAVMELREIEGN